MTETTTAFDVITMGETMMAFEAQDYGPLRENSIYRKWIGGAEDNLIIGLARLGFRCGWFSRLGDDEFGKEIYRTIKGEGVDVSRVTFDSGAGTGVFFVERQAEGDFRCYYYRQLSAASRLCQGDIDPDYIRSTKIVYMTGITPALSESAREATEEIFRLATKNKQTVIFDPNLRLKLFSIDRARKVLTPLMQRSTYVLPGEKELKQLMDCEQLEVAIEKAHDLGIESLIVKRGAEGAVTAIAGEKGVNVPAYVLKNPVSSMGAGDCFAAGFTAGLLKGQPLEECARWGNAMGAFCLMGWGPYQTLPSYDELESFLQGEALISR
jgi:2-dehydro-3-deoxygluconokinase